ncbi:MAG TPA: ComF family protein [Alphaproteobacteria bacterium]|nr:ComF family protein [Alphaproteobacteria bacterium]
MASQLRDVLAMLTRRALDIVLPPQCLSCGALVESANALCASCWSRITWIAAPYCACCGLPFDFDPAASRADAILCTGCLAEPPEFRRARAAFRYDDGGKRLILGLKFGDRTDSAPAFGRWLARAGAESLADADMVAPVPMHWTRLAWRKYNQSSLLALAVARAAGLRCAPDLLIRRRRTPPQGDLGRNERWRNVRGAFAVNRRHASAVAGTRVVLVDDVLTTGATARHCARALLGAGAASVDLLTLARVVRPGGGGNG